MSVTKKYFGINKTLKTKGMAFDADGSKYLIPYVTRLLTLEWSDKQIILDSLKEKIKKLSGESKKLKYEIKLLSDPILAPYLKRDAASQPSSLQSKLSTIKTELRFYYFVQSSIRQGKVLTPTNKSKGGYRVERLFDEYYGVRVRQSQPLQYRIECRPLHNINTKLHELDIFLGIANEAAHKKASRMNEKIKEFYSKKYESNPRYNEIKEEMGKLSNEFDGIVSKTQEDSLDFIKGLAVENQVVNKKDKK